MSCPTTISYFKLNISPSSFWKFESKATS
jgi:hypothetical protein